MASYTQIAVNVAYLYEVVDLGLYTISGHRLGFALLQQVFLLLEKFAFPLVKPIYRARTRSSCDNAEDKEVHVPLAFRELKAQAVEHQLMFVCQHLWHPRFLRRELLELIQRV